jgi:CDP-diacylglycerol--glycerol-3-phosphate 3-phosphatidyltransferase
MNLPNKISISRIIMVPLFMLAITPLPGWFVDLNHGGWTLTANTFILKYGIYIAAGIFIVASATDGLDGYLARKYNQITSLGIFLDPIADKLLITASLLALSGRGLLSAWTVIIIVSREFLVTGLRLVAATKGKVISSGIFGKVKMVFQIVAIFGALIVNDPANLIVRVLLFLMVVITIYSGIDYFVKNRDVLKDISTNKELT